MDGPKTYRYRQPGKPYNKKEQGLCCIWLDSKRGLRLCFNIIERVDTCQ